MLASSARACSKLAAGVGAGAGEGAVAQPDLAVVPETTGGSRASTEEAVPRLPWTTWSRGAAPVPCCPRCCFSVRLPRGRNCRVAGDEARNATPSAALSVTGESSGAGAIILPRARNTISTYLVG